MKKSMIKITAKGSNKDIDDFKLKMIKLILSCNLASLQFEFDSCVFEKPEAVEKRILKQDTKTIGTVAKGPCSEFIIEQLKKSPRTREYLAEALMKNGLTKSETKAHVMGHISVIINKLKRMGYPIVKLSHHKYLLENYAFYKTGRSKTKLKRYQLPKLLEVA